MGTTERFDPGVGLAALMLVVVVCLIAGGVIGYFIGLSA